MTISGKRGEGRSKQPRGRSAEERHQALEDSSKMWDSRIKGTIKQARKAARRSTA